MGRSEMAMTDAPRQTRTRATPAYAQVVGDMTFTPGDGVPQPIPKVRVEVALSADSATLSWEAEPGVVAAAAIPRMLFDEHLARGRIAWLSPA